jgi:hypothetical protein
MLGSEEKGDLTLCPEGTGKPLKATGRGSAESALCIERPPGAHWRERGKARRNWCNTFNKCLLNVPGTPVRTQLDQTENNLPSSCSYWDDGGGESGEHRH